MLEALLVSQNVHHVGRVGRVEEREAGLQAERLGVARDELVGDSVERAPSKASRPLAVTAQGRGPRQHVVGSPARKGEQQDPLRWHSAFPRGGPHAQLACESCRCRHQRRLPADPRHGRLLPTEHRPDCIPCSIVVHVFDAIAPDHFRQGKPPLSASKPLRSDEWYRCWTPLRPGNAQGTRRLADNFPRGLTRPLRGSRLAALVEGRPRGGVSRGRAPSPEAASNQVSQPVSEASKQRLGGRVGVPVFAVLLAAGTAALLVWGPIGAEVPYRGLITQPLVAALLTVTFAAVVMGPVSVHYRGQTYLFALSEVPLLLGLVIAAPVVLVICRVLGEGFALGVIRRQSPMKLAFNLASAAMSCVVAIIVYRAILHPFIHPGSSRAAVLPIGWAAGAVALSAAFLYGHLAVTVVAPSERSRPAPQVRLRGHNRGPRPRLEHRPCSRRPRRRLVGHLGSPAPRHRWCPDRVRLQGLPPPDEPFRRPAAALRLLQVRQRPLPRDGGHGLGSARAGSVGHAGQPGRAHHRRRVALGTPHRLERGRPLDSAAHDRRQLLCHRQGYHQTAGEPACRHERQPQARSRTSTRCSASSGAR